MLDRQRSICQPSNFLFYVRRRPASAQCTYIVVEPIQPGVALQPPSNADDDVKLRCQLPQKEITSTPPDRQGAGPGAILVL